MGSRTPQNRFIFQIFLQRLPTCTRRAGYSKAARDHNVWLMAQFVLASFWTVPADVAQLTREWRLPASCRPGRRAHTSSASHGAAVTPKWRPVGQHANRRRETHLDGSCLGGQILDLCSSDRGGFGTRPSGNSETLSSGFLEPVHRVF